MFKLLRKIKNKSSNFVATIETQVMHFRWKNFRSKNYSPENHKVRMLVIRKSEYVELARICVLSFLYLYPNSKIQIYCDEVTYSPLEKSLRKLISRKSVILIRLESQLQSWQNEKLSLILKMNGTNELFLDADLRWNGLMNLEAGKCLFFADEFVLRNKSPYRQYLAQFESNANTERASMKNSSFFTFGGNKLETLEIECVWNAFNNHEQKLGLADIGAEDHLMLSRLSEQLALSIASANWSFPISYLKTSDSIVDGQFVESCYFGATGRKF